jgi:hypothetical protein
MGQNPSRDADLTHCKGSCEGVETFAVLTPTESTDFSPAPLPVNRAEIEGFGAVFTPKVHSHGLDPFERTFAQC